MVSFARSVKGADATSSNIMLHCGIHPYPLKCHQISDHSQMPCQRPPYTDVCTANRHKLKWECHQSKPDSCDFRKEAEREEEKRKRELELKQKLEEEEHKRLVQRAEEQLTCARLSWMLS
jgi:hypothetical protein